MMKRISNVAHKLRNGIENVPTQNDELKQFVDFIAVTVGDTKKLSPLDLVHLLYIVLNDNIQNESLLQLASSKHTLENVNYSVPRASFPPDLYGKREEIIKNLGYFLKVVETFNDTEFSDQFRGLFVIVFGA